MVYLVFEIIFGILWQIFNAIGQIVFDVYGEILKK